MPNEFAYKIFGHEHDVILAISDLSLVGKSFEEGDLQIDVSEDFYCDKECSRDEALELIKNATIINAVGKRIITLMLKENIIDKKTVLTIDGVPHAQVVKIKGE